MKNILRSYFYWTYPRGSVHYDVMVTLILLFIFVTPQFWNFGDKPSNLAGPSQPIQIIGNDGHGLIITVAASDVNVSPEADLATVRKALRKAIEPVTGDAEFVEHWELSRDAEGKPLAWKIWAHR